MEAVGPAGIRVWWRESLAFIAAALSVCCAVSTGGLLAPCLLLSYLAMAVLLPDALSLRSRLAAVEHQQRAALWPPGASAPPFLSLAELTTDTVICTDAEGRITFWNRAAEKLLGYGREEALGSPLSRFLPDLILPSTHGGSAPSTSSSADTLAPSSPKSATGLRKDGSKTGFDLSVSTWHEAGEARFMVVATSATAQEETQGRLERLEQLAGSMRAVGRAAHDLNNLLSPLLTYVEMIEMELPPDHPLACYCSAIADSTKRMSGIARDLSLLSRSSPTEPGG